MKIYADCNISLMNQLSKEQPHLSITLVSKFKPELIRNADVLFVRSVTPVNQTLLENSAVKFIASATAGIDHLDLNYLNKRKIAWAYAAGCNAQAVANYVLLSIAHLKQDGLLSKPTLCAGVIGCGHVGKQVATMLQQLNFTVVHHDPYRAQHDTTFTSTPLEKFSDLDLICLHTPLITSGPYSNYHKINHHFFAQLKKDCVLLNAGRGGVVDSTALKQAAHLIKVIDVWENEPNIDSSLAEAAYIATPHIAGYSKPAKLRATKQIITAYYRYLNRPPTEAKMANHDPHDFITVDLSQPNWVEQITQFENLRALAHSFQQTLQQNPNHPGSAFKRARTNYLFRPEFIILKTAG